MAMKYTFCSIMIINWKLTTTALMMRESNTECILWSCTYQSVDGISLSSNSKWLLSSCWILKNFSLFIIYFKLTPDFKSDTHLFFFFIYLLLFKNVGLNQSFHMIGPYYLYIIACTERWKIGMIMNTSLVILLFCRMKQSFEETKVKKIRSTQLWDWMDQQD